MILFFFFRYRKETKWNVWKFCSIADDWWCSLVSRLTSSVELYVINFHNHYELASEWASLFYFFFLFFPPFWVSFSAHAIQVKSTKQTNERRNDEKLIPSKGAVRCRITILMWITQPAKAMLVVLYMFVQFQRCFSCLRVSNSTLNDGAIKLNWW